MGCPHRRVLRGGEGALVSHAPERQWKGGGESKEAVASTEDKGSVFAAKAVASTGQRQCFCCEGIGKHKANAVSEPRRQWNTQGKGGVLAAKAAQTQGKGGALATKAVETKGKAGALATKAVETKGECGALAKKAVETKGKAPVGRAPLVEYLVELLVVLVEDGLSAHSPW